jgi:hypothetical protein
MLLASLGLIVLMIAALPWGRRVWDRSRPDEPADQGVPTISLPADSPAPADRTESRIIR